MPAIQPYQFYSLYALIMIVLGMALGIGNTISQFDFNNRDCMIVCPSNAESIQYRGECYCKLEKE